MGCPFHAEVKAALSHMRITTRTEAPSGALKTVQAELGPAVEELATEASDSCGSVA